MKCPADLVVDAMFCRRSDDGTGELLLDVILHGEDGAHGRTVRNLQFRLAKF